MKHRSGYNHIVITFAAFAFAAVLLFCGAQAAFAAESIPVEIVIYENGDLDRTQTVWKGTYSASADGSVPIKSVADDLASKAPDGCTFGLGAVRKGGETLMFQVADIDIVAGAYRLVDNTSYMVQEDDALGLFYYPTTVTVPVYWLQSDDDGLLRELSNKEYKVLIGGEKRVRSIAVTSGKAASMGPLDNCDVITGGASFGASEVTAYIVGADGLQDGALNDVPVDSSSNDFLGGDDSATQRYKLDSEGLLLENKPLGISFTGITVAGLENNVQEQLDTTDAGDGADVTVGALDVTSDPESGLSETETISGVLPAVYVIVSGTGSNSLIPWILAAVATVLILISIIALFKKRKRVE